MAAVFSHANCLLAVSSRHSSSTCVTSTRRRLQSSGPRACVLGRADGCTIARQPQDPSMIKPRFTRYTIDIQRLKTAPLAATTGWPFIRISLRIACRCVSCPLMRGTASPGSIETGSKTYICLGVDSGRNTPKPSLAGCGNVFEQFRTARLRLTACTPSSGCRASSA